MESNNALLSVVFSALGGILLLLTDFAGWTEPTSYGDNDYYVFIGSEYAPLFSQLLVAIMGLALLATAYFSYRVMQGEQGLVRQAYQLAIGSLVLVVVSAVLFFIIAWDATYSWLDVGFYGGLIGSAASIFFLRQAN